MPSLLLRCAVVVSIASANASFAKAALISDFENLTLAPNSNWHGPDPYGTEVPGVFGPVIEGHFTSGGVTFTNRYDQNFSYWSGFAYSNEKDTTTAGFTNQYSAYPGAASSGNNFGVAFGYDDIEPNLFDGSPVDPTDVANLLQLPHFTISDGYSIVGMDVTNTTYAALSMLEGDSFAKKFGGITGNDPDWFKISAYGIGADGVALGASKDFYLADYRFTDNSLDYLVNTWEFFDLSDLANAGARTIAFNVSSSDVGLFGLNTPGYFAVDDVVLLESVAPVPEPASVALLAIGAVTFGCRRVLRRRQTV